MLGPRGFVPLPQPGSSEQGWPSPVRILLTVGRNPREKNAGGVSEDSEDLRRKLGDALGFEEIPFFHFPTGLMWGQVHSETGGWETSRWPSQGAEAIGSDVNCLEQPEETM